MSDLCYTSIQCPSFFNIEGDCETVGHDIKVTNGCLGSGDPLISAVLIQLLSDRREGSAGGFWGDEFLGFNLGSSLWTLNGQPNTSELNVRVDEMIREALDPLINQGFMDEVQVRVVRKIDGPEARVNLLKEGKSLFSVQL